MHSTQHIIGKACLQLCQQSLLLLMIKNIVSVTGGRFMSVCQSCQCVR